MASARLLSIPGRLVLVGKRPDGDSIRFVPDSPAGLRRLDGAERLRPSGDGSVQLRFEGIDAPETHYGRYAQPLGTEARDRLLALAGFGRVTLDASGTVTGASPTTRVATVLSKAVEANGRPVAYVFVGERRPRRAGLTELDATLLRRSLNARLLAGGLAYLTLYTSTPELDRRVLTELARGPRDRRQGVWGADRSRGFLLTDHDSIGPGGALVLPKLFRRCNDYLTDRERGFEGTLAEWLRATPPGARPRDDGVIVGGRRTRLSALVGQEGDRVSFSTDLLDLVFVENPPLSRSGPRRR